MTVLLLLAYLSCINMLEGHREPRERPQRLLRAALVLLLGLAARVAAQSNQARLSMRSKRTAPACRAQPPALPLPPLPLQQLLSPPALSLP